MEIELNDFKRITGLVGSSRDTLFKGVKQMLTVSEALELAERLRERAKIELTQQELKGHLEEFLKYKNQGLFKPKGKVAEYLNRVKQEGMTDELKEKATEIKKELEKTHPFHWITVRHASIKADISPSHFLAEIESEQNPELEIRLGEEIKKKVKFRPTGMPQLKDEYRCVHPFAVYKILALQQYRRNNKLPIRLPLKKTETQKPKQTKKPKQVTRKPVVNEGEIDDFDFEDKPKPVQTTHSISVEEAQRIAPHLRPLGLARRLEKHGNETEFKDGVMAFPSIVQFRGRIITLKQFVKETDKER